jgi:phage terminase large subunit-like protein
VPTATLADLVPPTFECAPVAHSSFGAEAVELAASAGLVLDPWQVYALERILAEDEHGRPASFEAALIVPRQNGKGSVLEALSLAWLFLTDAPLILHSAHEFKTAAEGFRRLRTLIGGAPHLASMVGRITTAAGNEAIELTTGQRLRYVARSKGSGRGFSADKIILDEAYALSDDEMAALLPTLPSARRTASAATTRTRARASATASTATPARSAAPPRPRRA